MRQKSTLALTRKEGEEIVIKTQHGEEIVIGIQQIQSSQAKLYFKAEKSTTVVRRELTWQE